MYLLASPSAFLCRDLPHRGITGYRANSSTQHRLQATARRTLHMSCIQPAFFLARQLGREVWVDDAGDAWLRPDLLMESAVSDLATKELTFVMSWAMRHILPARDSEARLHDAPVSARLSVAVTKIWYHSLVSYYALLNRSYMRKTGQHDPQLMILCRYREVSSARASIEQDVPIRIPRGVQRARGWAPKALCPWESEEGSGIVLTVPLRPWKES